MDTHFKKARLSSSHTKRKTEQIQAELIDIIYKQSYIGIIISTINAAALTFLVWHQIDHRYLNFWFSSFLLVSGLRAVLVHQYHRLKVSAEQAKPWGRMNLAGLALTGVLWGSAMIIIFPSDSLPHQLCMALLLCGIITTAISLYAVVPMAVALFSLPIFIAWIIRFFTFSDAIHMVIATMAVLYMGIMILALHHISRTRRELLTARFSLANRVIERSQALKESNTCLQTEINERKAIEERLRQEKDRLEIITSTIGAGLAVISKKYRTLWANRIYTDIFGKNIGNPCYESQRKQNICEQCGTRMIFEQNQEKIIHERIYLNTQGKPTWFQVVTTPIRNPRGHIRAALKLVIPISERIEAEAAQLQMLKKLEGARKAEAIATLAGGIAHQFNNKLAVISGNMELLEHDYRNDPLVTEYSIPIFKACKKMTELTNQLLAYAKGGKYKACTTDLGKVINTTLTFIKHTIDRNINVHLKTDKDLPQVRIDITQIQMVISSIVSNAVEATQKDGQIHIFCKHLEVNNENRKQHDNIPQGRYAAFITVDNGTGMDAETQKRIFEPFFTTKFKGRGLAMAAVDGIIKSHDGYIHISSQPEKGTAVRIYLPAAKEFATSQFDVNNQLVHGSGTILAVEDDVAIIEVIQVWLKRIGYDVIIATSGREAIEIIRHTKLSFDLVLLDLMLPDMDGTAIFPIIREHRPAVKVIICSGYGQSGTTEELLDAGAEGYLQKPFTLNQISKKLHEVNSAKAPLNA